MPIFKSEDFIETYRAFANNLKNPNELTGRNNKIELTRVRVQFVRENILATDRRFQTAVDVGCGDGSFIGSLADIASYRCGILPTQEEVNAVKKITADRGHDCEIRLGLTTALPFMDGSVDLVVCNSVLHGSGYDSEFAERSIREFARVQPKGGVLYVGEIPELNEKEGRDYGSSFARFLIWSVKNKSLSYTTRHLVDYLRCLTTSKTYYLQPTTMFFEDKKRFCERLSGCGYQVLAVFRSSTNQKITVEDMVEHQRLDYLCIRH